MSLPGRGTSWQPRPRTWGGPRVPAVQVLGHSRGGACWARAARAPRDPRSAWTAPHRCRGGHGVGGAAGVGLSRRRWRCPGGRGPAADGRHRDRSRLSDGDAHHVDVLGPARRHRLAAAGLLAVRRHPRRARRAGRRRSGGLLARRAAGDPARPRIDGGASAPESPGSAAPSPCTTAAASRSTAAAIDARPLFHSRPARRAAAPRRRGCRAWTWMPTTGSRAS